MIITNKNILSINPSNLTPGMQQYFQAKKQNPECLIMLRMGDFYEMFYEDAMTAARELEITLTARGKGEKRAPLAGIPFHALEPYLARLVKKGYKVAIIEQLEDPKKAKGLVKRGLVRIVTPGTIIESSMLNEKENNYIMAFTVSGEEYATAVCDLSTGEFFTVNLHGTTALLNEITRYNPSECLIPESLLVDTELIEKIKAMGCFRNALADIYFSQQHAQRVLQEHFHLPSTESLGLSKENVNTAGALLQYLLDTQKKGLGHLKRVTVRNNQQTMLLDGSTIRNLELLKNIKDGSMRGSLLEVIDKTVTSMGARLLKQWLKAPLLERTAIEQRVHAVQVLYQNAILREEIITLLKEIYDLERLIGRINYGNASPRDLLSLGQSLERIPLLQQHLSKASSSLLEKITAMPNLQNLASLIRNAIKQDAPLTLREGGIINPSFDEELASLHSLRKNSTHYLQQLEEKEIKKTGISSLKISYNRVFGYFIEVTKRNMHLIPAHYIRKQTTANGERYITEELKQEEEKILGADEKIKDLEYAIFQKIITQIAEKTKEIQHSARKIAVLDVLCSFAIGAAENGYVAPQFVEESLLHIRKGRHPVVEKIEPRFVTNDIILDPGEMLIITGPNMAGKSTIMRQTALIVLLAQMGSFVPAEKCTLGIVDRIFTRVGAYDDLSSGQSTFMVEMSETASILNNATARSLIILDEIGRGTSTFDGVSIAWSVAEHLYNHIKGKTLFATHYHVLNKLAEKFTRIKNYNIAVKEVRGEIIFLRKLVEGGTDESYGIHVAKLAGLPEEVILRAREIQDILQRDDDMMRRIKAKKLEEQKGLEEYGQ